MKQHLIKFIKRGLQRVIDKQNELKNSVPQTVEIEPSVKLDTECLIDNIGNEDYVLSTWIKHNYRWIMIIQTRRDGNIVTKMNDIRINKDLVDDLGIRFTYNYVQKELSLINEKLESPFVTATTFSFLK